ncbi:hypothetical protein N7451_010722 [Penicillium sp. IBT 35674x]|nr:hypothetical protein N7451_010722 [Penicillium sp. IBT 35674x]
MTLEPDNVPTIADAAGRCLNRFQQCLHQSALISPQETALAEDQLARFSLWTAGIGVFVGGRASLDHRLREAQEVHDVITGLLETLEDQVEAWSDALESIIRPPTSQTVREPDTKLITRLRRAVADQIALLHRLSNTIRRASSETPNAKGSMVFTIRDEEGNDVESCLQIVFANYIRDKFRNMDEKLLKRMVSAMILRRKRILYKRSRFNHGALNVPPATSLPKATPPPMTAAQQTAVSDPEIPSTSPPLPPQLPAKSQTGFSATTLAVEKFRKASTPSAVSAVKTIALSSHEALPFPVAPLGRVRQRYKRMRKIREDEYRRNLQYLSDNFDSQQSSPTIDGLKRQAEADLKQDLRTYWDLCVEAIREITCPFCFYAIPAREMQNDAKWKAHVKDDLDAYVCLFDECDNPDQLYSHNEQWLKHMEEHALRWRCNSKSHGLLIFHTRDRYTEHMRQAHQGAFSEVQLRVLADRNSRAIDPLFESCPFCGSTDTPQGGTIMEHIVGHLRFLALKSLPLYQDEASEASDGDSATTKASKTHNRSTIDNDPDRLTAFTFEDLGSEIVNKVPNIEENSPSGGFSSPVSERLSGLANTYTRAPLPDLESSSPKEEWSKFIQGPSPGRNSSHESERQLEWGFVTADLERYTDVDDPVLRDFSNRRCHTSPAMNQSQQVLTSGDAADIHMHIMNDIREDEAVVPMSETPQHLLAKSDTDRPSDANPALIVRKDGNECVSHTGPSSEKPLARITTECLQGNGLAGSSSSLLPVADAPGSDHTSPPPSPLHGDPSKMGHMDVSSRQLSGEVSGVSDAPTTQPLSEAVLVPAQQLECILDDSGPVGPAQRSSVDAPKEKSIDNSILDDMISRLIGLVDTTSKKGSKRLFGLVGISRKKSLCINNSEIEMICDASRELFLSQPALLELKAPVKVVGDVHGQYIDLIRLFQLCGFPPTANYLFLGDYVDRGKQGLETILLLLCYKLKYPENFFLLRGNHECANVTRIYGFFDECKRRANIKTWKKFIDVFNCMPIAAIIASKIFCVHGGLSPALAHMDNIRQIPRPTDVPDDGLLADLLWSDPADMEEDWEPNERGVSYCFGKQVIIDFLLRFDIDLICRAHMVVEDGYEFYQDRLLVTVFSAPNLTVLQYCGEFDNWGGVMDVSDELLCSFQLLKPLNWADAPRPPPSTTPSNAVEEEFGIDDLFQGED